MISLDKIEIFQGSVCPEEAQYLAFLASQTKGNAIVEIGSWRGKSAVALAAGACKQESSKPVMVYCIDPHSPFKGVYGGNFGSADRKHFYQTMLQAECTANVALVNLPSLQAAKGWSVPIGMLFIDGDHTEASVQKDIDAWLPHVVENGFVVFDDAKDKNIGPYHVVERMIANGSLKFSDDVGKTITLTKS